MQITSQMSDVFFNSTFIVNAHAVLFLYQLKMQCRKPSDDFNELIFNFIMAFPSKVYSFVHVFFDQENKYFVVTISFVFQIYYWTTVQQKMHIRKLILGYDTTLFFHCCVLRREQEVCICDRLMTFGRKMKRQICLCGVACVDEGVARVA